VLESAEHAVDTFVAAEFEGLEYVFAEELGDGWAVDAEGAAGEPRGVAKPISSTPAPAFTALCSTK
jgi:hypothetical protein